MNPSEPFIRRPVMTLLMTVSAILFGVLVIGNFLMLRVTKPVDTREES